MWGVAHMQESRRRRRSSEHAAEPTAADGKLIQDEERTAGSVKFKHYLQYIKAAGGWPFFIALFLSLGIGQVTTHTAASCEQLAYVLRTSLCSHRIYSMVDLM